MKPVEMLRIMARSRRSRRDRIAVLLSGLLGLKMKELQHLTLRDAVARLLPLKQDDPSGLVNQLLKILGAMYKEGYAQDQLLLPSTRHKGRLDRTGMFRILQGALRAAMGSAAKAPLRALQTVAKALQGLCPVWHVESVSRDGRAPCAELDDLAQLLMEDPAPA